MTDEPPPWCPCPPSDDVHQDTCPQYLEVLRRMQEWRGGAK